MTICIAVRGLPEAQSKRRVLHAVATKAEEKEASHQLRKGKFWAHK